MAVLLLVGTAMLGILFNTIPFVADAQSLQAVIAPPKGKDRAPMVEIPSGSFPMGVPPGDRDGGRDEYPRHEVVLDTFFIDQFEVTNGYPEFVSTAMWSTESQQSYPEPVAR